MAAKSDNPAPATALVCTLGGKPQVVALALERLLAREKADGIEVSLVCVFHLSLEDERINRSVSRLRHELRTRYGGRIKFLTEPVRPMRVSVTGARPGLVTGPAIKDKTAPEFGDAAYYTACRVLARLKNEGYRIELCCTGGPHALGLIVHSAATLVCTAHDRLWDLHTPPDVITHLVEGEVMRAPADADIRLTQLRFVGLGQLLVNLQAAARMTPEEIVAVGNRQVRQIDEDRCRAVLRALTPAQRRVLRVFATHPESIAQIAARLNVSVDTVHSHKRIIFKRCREHFPLDEKAQLHFSFLREHFGDLPGSFWDGALVDTA